MSTQDFQKRFLPLAGRLYATAFTLLRNSGDAEDAVQDTYLRAWQQAEALRAMERPEGFLLTTLRHICLDKLRLRREEGDVEEENPPPGQWPAAPPADGRLEAGDQLRYLLAQLPPRARRIVRLRHIGAYSTQEISRLTGETEANVRVILSRARQKLRQCMLNEEYQSLARTQPYEKRT